MLLAMLMTAGCGLGNGLGNVLGNGKHTYTYDKLPQNLNDLKQLPGAQDLTDPYAVAALTIAALTFLRRKKVMKMIQVTLKE